MKADSDRIIEIFNQASTIAAPEERARFLDEACRDDPEARAQIESLLQAEEPARDFLKAPPPPDVSLTEKLGDRIGRYQLLEKIGEGGGGVVYMAEQEEPVRRRVALKIIKLGMETREVVARFEAERQALALMDHPNIARIFDAGVTEAPLPASGHPLPSSDEGRGQGEGSPPATRHSPLATHYGRPYFVMELVRGTPITQYCDEHRLTTRQRLELFVPVSQAVQHAHQKGIIHRDLKPSNVLITELDGRSTPKVIDFGVAKATEQRLTEKTLFTRFGQLVGTPAYMSPEQAGFGGLDIDTRSDVYSLGVLLYELLTGHPPFDSKKLLEAGYEAILKSIREVEPPKPSTKLSTLSREELVATASQRNAEPGKLNGLMRGELDWIVMKALEKDRARRYETAAGFANDILRHLNNEPVVARPPSKLYEFQKTVRRHKVGFAATGAIILALTLGMGFSIWTAVKEKRARQRAVLAEKHAEKEATKSKQVTKVLTAMLDGVGPSVALGRNTELLREILEKTAERLPKDLADQPGVRAELYLILGSAYHELGLYERMEQMGRDALQLNQSLFGDSSADVASSMKLVGDALRHQQKLTEAEPQLRGALAMFLKTSGTNDMALDTMNELGQLLHAQNKLKEAEDVYRQAIEGFNRLGAKRDVFSPMGNLVNLLHDWRRFSECEEILTNGIASARLILPPEHPTLLWLNGLLGDTYRRQGRYEDAEPILRQTMEVSRRIKGEEGLGTLTAMNSLAMVLESLGRFDEAIEIQSKVVEVETRRNPEAVGTFVVREVLASLYLKQRRLDVAEPQLSELLAATQKTLGPDNPRSISIALKLASVYGQQRKFEKSEELLTNAISAASRAVETSPRMAAGAKSALAKLYLEMGRAAEAERWAAESLALGQKNWPDDWQTYLVQAQFARSLQLQKKPAESEFVAAVSGLMAREKKIPSTSKTALKEALQWLVQLYEEIARPELAAEWNRRLNDLDKAESAKPAPAPPAN